MRIRIGTTRIESEDISAYRAETETSVPIVRVFLVGGGFLCLNARYEDMSVEDMIDKLDRAFFEEGEND